MGCVEDAQLARGSSHGPIRMNWLHGMATLETGWMLSSRNATLGQWDWAEMPRALSTVGAVELGEGKECALLVGSAVTAV